jgi:DNA-binding transcriptional LysR family regulator
MRAGLCEFRRRLPDVDIRTVDGSHERLLLALSADAVDIAITAGPSSAWSYRMLPLWSERVIAALPDSHALGRAERARWPDLAGEKFLLPQQGPGQELETLIAVKLRNTAATERTVR